jgi:hypothetical protein
MEDTSLINEDQDEKYLSIYHLFELEKLIENRALKDFRSNDRSKDKKSQSNFHNSSIWNDNFENI